MREDVPQEEVLAKEVGTVADLVADTAEMPRVRFVDITAAAGIDFVHTNGARGDKLLPETMGGGVAFLDVEGDGDPDLLFVNSAHWAGAGGEQPTTALYLNDGGGTFENATRAAGLDPAFYGMGVAVGDYDNDGDPDLFLTALGRNRLLANDGSGRFSDVTARAGVAGGAETWSSSAGFFDYDNDGDLDLFVCNYVRWSREIDVELNFTLNGTDRAYGPPTSYEGAHSYLYRNEGDGRFVDVSGPAGIEVVNPLNGRPMAKALALTFADVDRDGFLDVYVANDTVQNFLFRNRGDGTFEEVGAVSGLGFDGAGNATGAMGVDGGHYRNDGQFGVAIANFANEMSSLYVAQRESLQFTDEAAGEGIGAPSRLFLSFGLFFFDYDLDGRLDLLQSNGHLEDEIRQVQASQSYRQPAQLFWNQGSDARSCFAEVPADTVGDLARPIVGRGAAYADIDADGDLDVVLTQSGAAPLLLRNDQQLGRHWLRVALEGSSANRDAVGASVEVEAGGVTQRRRVMPTRSYLSQVEPLLTFGLDDAERIDSLRVTWPDGTIQAVSEVPLDGTLRIRQP
ncbi:MAG: CRTAC1 family protein [bacterium]|nr:CRTAC1 family protein [bacterium]